MNNIDRIHEELAKHASELGPEVGMDPTRFLEIVLEIVDAEDQHRIAKTNINQQVERVILNAALQSSSQGE
jgi:hypothetical protein